MADAKLPRPTFGQLWPPVPVIHEPNPEDKLWRFIDFAKFVSIIDQGALFLPNASRFTDKWEGSYPIRDSFAGGADSTLKSDQLAALIKRREEFKKNYFISCWHINDHESTAMWDLYRNGGFGIAIQSTYKNLIDSIGDISRIRNSGFYIGFPKVNYIDYETETFEGHVAEVDLTPFFHKRKSFQHENEFRILMMSHFNSVEGVLLKVNLPTLISNVYISPMAPKWFEGSVISVLRKFDLPEIHVKHSDIEKDPIY